LRTVVKETMEDRKLMYVPNNDINTNISKADKIHSVHYKHVLETNHLSDCTCRITPEDINSLTNYRNGSEYFKILLGTKLQITL
jgi:hypothetical protein